jgi:hypothetical protein
MWKQRFSDHFLNEMPAQTRTAQWIVKLMNDADERAQKWLETQMGPRNSQRFNKHAWW